MTGLGKLEVTLEDEEEDEDEDESVLSEDENNHETSLSEDFKDEKMLKEEDEDEDESLLSKDDDEEIKELEGIRKKFPEIINFEDPDHNTLLIHSIKAHNLSIFRHLLEKGASTFVSKNVFDISCL